MVCAGARPPFVSLKGPLQVSSHHTTTTTTHPPTTVPKMTMESPADRRGNGQGLGSGVVVVFFLPSGTCHISQG